MPKQGRNKKQQTPTPRPKGYTLQIVWFAPKREGSPRQAIASVDELQAALKPHESHERLVVYLEKDGGEGGSVYVHRTGDRAWVTHFQSLGGLDSYCRDPQFAGSDESISFFLSNGQEDEIHKYWTVPLAQAQQALEHFMQTGQRDPSLDWVAEPHSLEEPPN